MSNNKAIWDSKTTECFIKACLNQVYKGERTGTTFTKKAWKAIVSEFSEKAGKQYDKQKFINKWDNLRKEWAVRYKLKTKETGVGWDYDNNTVDAPDEWGEKKLLEKPQYAKYRYKGLPFGDELTILFKDVAATGKHEWAPNSGKLPTNIDENDVYRPSFEGVGCLDLEEGSGDSDEILGDNVETSAGVGAKLGNINLSSSHGNSSEMSNGKRKRVGPSETNESKKKEKAPASKKIADAISRIASASESRSAVVNTLVMSTTSIGEVMVELQQMESITSDPELYARCCHLMMFKSAREMFTAMKNYEHGLLKWLKYTAYNPSPFMKN